MPRLNADRIARVAAKLDPIVDAPAGTVARVVARLRVRGGGLTFVQFYRSLLEALPDHLARRLEKPGNTSGVRGGAGVDEVHHDRGWKGLVVVASARVGEAPRLDLAYSDMNPAACAGTRPRVARRAAKLRVEFSSTVEGI